MGIQRIEEALVSTGLQAVRSGEPLVDLRLLGITVRDLFERRHCSSDMRNEPDGAGDDSCREQFGGLGEVSTWYE